MKYRYQNLQTQTKNKNANIYPTYNSVRGVKIKYHIHLSEILVTETITSIKLQRLLDHTVQPLLLKNSITNNILFNKFKLK